MKRPPWLNRLLQKRKTQCILCHETNPAHLVMSQRPLEPLSYQPREEYSDAQIKHLLNLFDPMCCYCSRLRRKIRQFAFQPPNFDPTLPCTGLLCRQKSSIRQLCTACHYHRRELVEKLWLKVDRLKRRAKQCAHCDRPITTSNGICFDFDHLDPLKKCANICDMVVHLCPIHLIRKEIKKCRVLCSNCHAVHTRTQKNIHTPELLSLRRYLRRQTRHLNFVQAYLAKTQLVEGHQPGTIYPKDQPSTKRTTKPSKRQRKFWGPEDSDFGYLDPCQSKIT